MFNLFEGGTKGRLFNNSAKGGKEVREEWTRRMKMKKGIVCVVVMIGALVLVGWGCGSRTAAPADTNSETNDVSDTSPDGAPEVTSEDGTTPEDGTPSGWTEYRNTELGFSFQYPEGWRIQTFDDDPSRVAIIATDNPGAEGQEPLPEISMLLRDNPERLALREFYERAQESIFEDAVGGVTPVEVGGNQGFFLLDVSGEVSTDLIVLTHGTDVVEFELTSDQYSGEFDDLVNSFRFLGGE